MDAGARDVVVVGVDGSAPCGHALRWTAALAGLLDADVVAVHGVGLLDRLDGELVLAHPHLDELRRVVADEWCRPLADAGIAFRVEVVERPAVDALLHTAARDRAELVVLGTRGRGLAADRALGSTALQLLQRADIPALVVPDGPAPALRRIVVAVDGSPDAEAARAWADRLASRTGATCAVATATEGDPAAAIVRLADQDGADLVVVGSSGAAPVGDPLAGSVSRMVAHEAGRPVAVVPVPAGTADQR